MKPSQAAELVAVLIATYPWVPTTAATSAGYERGLIDLDHTVANAAVEAVIATHSYPNRLPTVAEIRETALALTSGAVRTGLDAWGDVGRLMRRGFSSHKPPVADNVADPIVWECIQDLGWRSLCLADEDDPSARARFIDSYDKRAVTARRDVITRTLPAVSRVRELAQGEKPRRSMALDEGSVGLRRATLALAAHPAAKTDPDAVRALEQAYAELRHQGAAEPGPALLGSLLAQVQRGGAR